MQDPQIADQDQQQQQQQFQPALPFRNQTILGVCEGVGEDSGISPTLLRIVFCGAIFWSPPAAVGAYLGLGLIVLAARLIFPAPRRPIVAYRAAAPSLARQPVEEQEELQLAA